MSVPDWNRGDLNHQWRVVFLDPLNLKTVRGEIQNVSSGKLSVDYESNTLYGFSFTSYHDGFFEWDGTSAVKVIHSIGTWSEDLFTGYVTDISYDRNDGFGNSSNGKGSTVTSWTLSSALYGITSDKLSSVYTVGSGAMALDVIKYSFRSMHRDAYKIESTALDYKYGSALAYPLKTSWYQIIYDACLLSGNELSVDGSGTIVISRFLPNKQKTPEYTLQTIGQKANAIGSSKINDQTPSIPSKYVVVAKNEDYEVIGYYNRESSDILNAQRRGYCLSEFYEYDDLVPCTVDQATAKAKELADSESKKKDRSVSSLYMPFKAGTIVNYSDNNGTYKSYIKNGDLDLDSWTWSLTITEV